MEMCECSREDIVVLVGDLGNKVTRWGGEERNEKGMEMGIISAFTASALGIVSNTDHIHRPCYPHFPFPSPLIPRYPASHSGPHSETQYSGARTWVQIQALGWAESPIQNNSNCWLISGPSPPPPFLGPKIRRNCGPSSRYGGLGGTRQSWRQRPLLPIQTQRSPSAKGWVDYSWWWCQQLGGADVTYSGGKLRVFMCVQPNHHT